MYIGLSESGEERRGKFYLETNATMIEHVRAEELAGKVRANRTVALAASIPIFGKVWR